MDRKGLTLDNRYDTMTDEEISEMLSRCRNCSDCSKNDKKELVEQTKEEDQIMSHYDALREMELREMELREKYEALQLQADLDRLRMKEMHELIDEQTRVDKSRTILSDDTLDALCRDSLRWHRNQICKDLADFAYRGKKIHPDDLKYYTEILPKFNAVCAFYGIEERGYDYYKDID